MLSVPETTARPIFASKLDASTGADAAITVSADAAEIWSLDWVHYSYHLAGAGKLTISIGGTVVWEVNVTAAGPGFVEFPGGLYGIKNQVLLVTLLGVGSKDGKLNIRYR